ncbi:interferon-induced protein with tetratricopeptide repeats 5-like [Alosa pseudoharengus]|uniref:interferon-induced protein with tetratricopeptide repeats 5-like n=1 Tax=Alosa pseudoharengus TaxID=34774 RepID=UPI003F8AF899
MDRNISILHRQQEHLEDRSRHGCAGEGHLYSLLGYVIYHIKDSAEEALIHLRQAEVALKQQEPEGRGPHLLVNQANLAWVHFHLGELPECQAYLEEVVRLQEDFPAPPGCELHPEVYGEKGWTILKLQVTKLRKAVANFEMALKGDPYRKEWHVGLALAKCKVYFHEGNKELRGEIIEQINIAKAKDPDNLHMLAIYWNALADVGRKTETVREVHELAQQLNTDLDGLETFFTSYVPTILWIQPYKLVGYGCHLNWLKRSSSSESIVYHKKAAEIPKQSREREKSVKILRTIVNRGTHQRCSEI